MIDLTPLEVRKKKGDFKRAMRGYDTPLVDDFLDLVADRMEELVRENLSLTERTTRTEQQIAEYRERERALTEALVTAQEMREEVRRQATREAELAMRSATQEAAQLRSSAEQEASQLRSSAEQEASQLRSSAEQAAAQLRSSAEQAAAQLRSSAEQEAARLRAEVQQQTEKLRSEAQQEAVQLRTAALQQREREEDSAARLRARQQQVFATYRAFLERELTELRAVAKTLGMTGGSPEHVPEEGSAREAAAPHDAGSTARPAAAKAPLWPGMPDDGDEDDPAARALDAPIGGFTAGAMVSAAEPAIGDVPPVPEAEPAFMDELPTFADGSAAEDDPTFGDAALEDDADLVLIDDLPPFEPEPLEPEDEPVPAVPQSELDLYDAVAEPEPDAGLPGAIGLGDLSGATAWSTPAEWKVPGIDLVSDGSPPPDGPGMEPADEPVYELTEDEDEETSLLLRNAAAAGYRLPDEDELLLDETVEADEEEAAEPERGRPQPGGWLPSLLDDDRDDRFDA